MSGAVAKPDARTGSGNTPAELIELRTDAAERVKRDQCPVVGCDEVLSVLDTGWECLRCGFDAELIAATEGARRQ